MAQHGLCLTTAQWSRSRSHEAPPKRKRDKWGSGQLVRQDDPTSVTGLHVKSLGCISKILPWCDVATRLRCLCSMHGGWWSRVLPRLLGSLGYVLWAHLDGVQQAEEAPAEAGAHLRPRPCVQEHQQRATARRHLLDAVAAPGHLGLPPPAGHPLRPAHALHHLTGLPIHQHIGPAH